MLHVNYLVNQKYGFRWSKYEVWYFLNKSILPLQKKALFVIITVR